MHPHHTNANITVRAVTLLALLLACLLLAACGGSSKASSASTTSTSASRAPGGAKRFSALRECMQKSGITLPKRSAGKPSRGRPPTGGSFAPGGGTQLPKGVTQAQFQAALRKCGGAGFKGRGGFGGASSPTFRKALAKFASCMRENGVNVPTPNTSGAGPIFNTKGLDVGSAKFRAAQKKCSSLLRVSPGGAGQGAPPSGPGGGAPPAAG